MKYSVTQGANYVALAGTLVVVLNYFGVNVAEGDVITVISGIMILVGLITSVINRYNKGDVTALGAKKE